MQKFVGTLLLFSFFTLNVHAEPRGKVIYGEDNRRDVYSEERDDLRSLADSTVAIIAFDKLKQDKNGSVTLISGTFGKDFNLCTNEPFYNQPSAASCSGFLVGDDLIATAGHCLTVLNCSNFRFVFNYKMLDKDSARLEFTQDDVYTCKSILAREYTNNQDYALVQLDRPVRGHKPLQLSQKNIQTNDSLTVIGHPSGLPTKIADGANVREVKTGFFKANLDTYGGNSGSAVFNSNTNEIEGILVRGARDFVLDYENKCYRSNKCENTGCSGEDVTFISYINQAIKKSGRRN